MSAGAVSPSRYAAVAAGHLDEGWPVVPVAGKAVIVKWKAYQDRLPTPDELVSWPWSRATGLAVVIGSALWQRHPYRWALEIEARHRAHAEPWLDQEVPEWRSAGLVVESGGGGLHVYAESAAAVRSTRHAWGEIRGHGNICVLPPSRHPSGRRYRWLADVEPIRLDPADVPGREERDRFHFDEDSGPIGEGARNDTLFRLGCRLRYCGLTGGEIGTALRVVNRSRCRPALADEEVAAIATSAASYPVGDGCVVIRVPAGEQFPNLPDPLRAREGGNVSRTVNHPSRPKPPTLDFAAGRVVAR
jgi:hypothetical protein